MAYVITCIVVTCLVSALAVVEVIRISWEMSYTEMFKKVIKFIRRK